MSVSRRLCRALQGLVPAASGPGCTVLCYHLVGAGTASPVDLPEDLFRRHMEELAAGAEVVPLERAVRELSDGGGSSSAAAPVEAARPRVALTFDDAYRNVSDKVFPILSALRLPATLFVPVGFVEGECPPPIASVPLPAASWDELSELAGSGLVAIGSHTWSHRDLTSLPAGEVDRELRRSREHLEERLGVSVGSFCYPRARWSPAVEAQVRQVYDLSVVGGGRRLTASAADPYRIQRVSLRTDGPRSVGAILRSRVWLEERVADRVRRLR